MTPVGWRVDPGNPNLPRSTLNLHPLFSLSLSPPSPLPCSPCFFVHPSPPSPRSLQIVLLLLRSIKVRRFRALSVQTFGQQLAVAFMVGMFWWQVRNSAVCARLLATAAPLCHSW